MWAAVKAGVLCGYNKFLRIWRLIRVDFTPPKVRSATIRKVLAMVKPGDVLLRKYGDYLDEWFIPGDYSHGCIVSRAETTGTPGKVIHTVVTTGVDEIDLMEFILNTDKLLVLRPEYASEEDALAAVVWARTQIGKPYDVFFDWNEDSSYYCYELVHKAVISTGTHSLKDAPYDGEDFRSVFSEIFEF